ncbi:hypothetical protein ORI20_20805 [Mycobacterium sp. CVI_P3]|uniref:Cellulose biosynthesis cyclic di-GMP-binding regulatory protein BcsB n=1 Tax=Mycobacterium pinniadriaticum TaxID=2994102 RepID=A0ABT3SJ97_9MYCO|nr:hypothetical protein [Mycobacterium pinniadriaticum]MCX2932717.1 hypothetical protein [Mycobacterium pinniadriaticum]MCX2939223.1 hypothetical protein [Mycobacterium pinniadriaticum]
MSSALYFGAANATQTASIPTPDGLTPITLSGILHSATNIPQGYIEAETTDGQYLGTVPVPDLTAGRTSAPFSIDVSSVPVLHNQAQLNMVLRMTAGDTVCGPPPALVISGFSVTFSGDFNQPISLQQFFPAIAPNVDIYVDPQPTASEKLTALSLVAALTRRYQPATVRINLRQLARTDPAPPPDGDNLTRAIVIRDLKEVDNPGVQLVTDPMQRPYVVITGTGPTLEQQVALFREKLLTVAQTDSVTVNAEKVAPTQGARMATFGQLDISGGASVLGEATISLNLSTSSFTLSKPGMIEVHLLANYTPVDDNEKGTMVAAAGGIVLKTARLDRSGRLDTTFSIPAEIAARNTGLVLTVSYEPGAGGCTPRTVPMNFQVDPGSTAAVKAGGAVSMGGFSSLPQAFIPTFQVAMDGTDPDELAHAAAIIGLVQQISSIELRPILVSVDQVAASNSSALIIANAQAVHKQNLDPPIDTVGNLSNVDVPADVIADIPTGLASLQSYSQNNRTIVLLTASAGWDMAKPLFDYLGGLQGGWRDLGGDVLVAGQISSPQTLTVRASGPVPLADNPGTSWLKWAWLSGAVVGVSIIAIVFVLLIRRRSAKARD